MVSSNRISKVTVKCGACGHVFPSPIFIGDIRAYERAVIEGNAVNCPKCRALIHCDRENMTYVTDDSSQGFMGEKYSGNLVGSTDQGKEPLTDERIAERNRKAKNIIGKLEGDGNIKQLLEAAALELLNLEPKDFPERDLSNKFLTLLERLSGKRTISPDNFQDTIKQMSDSDAKAIAQDMRILAAAVLLAVPSAAEAAAQSKPGSNIPEGTTPPRGTWAPPSGKIEPPGGS